MSKSSFIPIAAKPISVINPAITYILVISTVNRDEIRVANIKTAIFVDDFLNQEQIVVKSLEKNYKKIDGISAATIRGDGNIGLILDIMNIIENEKTTSWNS